MLFRRGFTLRVGSGGARSRALEPASTAGGGGEVEGGTRNRWSTCFHYLYSHFDMQVCGDTCGVPSGNFGAGASGPGREVRSEGSC